MIKSDLLAQIMLANPWLKNPNTPIFTPPDGYVPRLQGSRLAESVWDKLITIITGPRQAGKTTLSRYLCQQLINENRYPAFLYLNCDERLIREWLTGSHVIQDIQKLLKNDSFILFIDEIQRLESPGLFLKSIYDLNLPIKLIATGSSQLELKSKVQEHLTGRQFSTTVLPLSYLELNNRIDLPSNLRYGCYPQIINNDNKSDLLSLLYQNYINKDIIEILKVRNTDTMQQLLTLIAHSSGQLVNYQQLATDCKVSGHTITHYLDILEATYILSSLKPFTGNKRQEITSNPVYYFLDNGFRNQALNNFAPLEQRSDMGLLIESAVFQEIKKLHEQFYASFKIHYWRTKGGAEVDFVLYKNEEHLLPIEVKYRNMNSPKISRAFRSFIEAYTPKTGLIITKDVWGEDTINNTVIRFIPFSSLTTALEEIATWAKD